MKRRVLVVDDAEDIREFVSETLNSAGYEVIEASDGNEALAILRENSSSHFYAIVTDYQMPNCDGFNLITEVIRDQFPIEKVILSSGRINFDFEMVQKPYPPDLLLEALTLRDE